MAKLFSFFFFMFAGATILCGIGEGNMGFATTVLSSSVSSVSTTINVTDTDDFLSGPDYIYIGDEKILYTSKTSTTFTVYDDGDTEEIDGRGYSGTTPKAHGAGSKVRNDNSDILNNVLGYNIAASSTTYGSLKAIVMTGLAVVKAIPKVLMWDYSFLNGGLMPVVKYLLLYPLSIGFIATLMMVFLQVAQGLVRL